MPTFYEDIVVGAVEAFGAYAVTREEVIEFASKYDPQPFHLDDEAAAQSLFGALCASGWHTSGMMMRMLVDHLTETEFAGLGSPGIDNIRWLKPVYPGDTLSLRMKITDKSLLKSRPGVGRLHNEMSVLNQKDETVMTMQSVTFVRCRPARGES